MAFWERHLQCTIYFDTHKGLLRLQMFYFCVIECLKQRFREYGSARSRVGVKQSSIRTDVFRRVLSNGSSSDNERCVKAPQLCDGLGRDLSELSIGINGVLRSTM